MVSQDYSIQQDLEEIQNVGTGVVDQEESTRGQKDILNDFVIKADWLFLFLLRLLIRSGKHLSIGQPQDNNDNLQSLPV